MMTPEFRMKLEDIMHDYYAAYDSGDMQVTDLASAIGDIAKNRNPKREEANGMSSGMLGAMIGLSILSLPLPPYPPPRKTDINPIET
jgi:hypothetical protein